MRSRWPRLLPLFVAAFWLPFQAVAAMGMSFCRHGEAHATVVTDGGTAEHCHMHESQAGADDLKSADLADANDICDNCEFCHLGNAGFMPAAEYLAAVVSLGRDFLPDFVLAPASAIPEPPQQPPRRLV